MGARERERESEIEDGGKGDCGQTDVLRILYDTILYYIILSSYTMLYYYYV